MNRTVSLMIIASLVCALAGCGGGHTAGQGAGRVVFTVKWPTRSRLIPAAANVVRITVTAGGKTFGPQDITLPATTTSFDNLPPGPATATAGAYPGDPNTTVPQAKGQLDVTIAANQTAQATVTMASTINNVLISPATPVVTVGKTVNLTATGQDAAGSAVLLSPSKLNWSATGNATVDQNGVVTGTAQGAATVTVQDTESKISGSVTFNVQQQTSSTPQWVLAADLGPDTHASDINALNHATGWTGSGSTARAFVWSEGIGIQRFTPANSISTSEHFGYSIATDGTNDIVAGYYFNGTNTIGFRWITNTAPEGLGQLDSEGLPNTLAASVNSSGKVVGWASDTQGGGSRAIEFNGPNFEIPGTLLPGYSISTARRINDAGQIVGDANSTSGGLGWYYDTGGVIQINPLLSDISTDALDINANGQVVGFSYSGTNAPYHAFVWTKAGTKALLGNLQQGFVSSAAVSINKAGHVLGFLSTAGKDASAATIHTFYWDSTNGLVDISDQLKGALGSFTLDEPARINDNDWIVGTGTVNGVKKGFILKPAP